MIKTIVARPNSADSARSANRPSPKTVIHPWRIEIVERQLARIVRLLNRYDLMDRRCVGGGPGRAFVGRHLQRAEMMKSKIGAGQQRDKSDQQSAPAHRARLLARTIGTRA